MIHESETKSGTNNIDLPWFEFAPAILLNLYMRSSEEHADGLNKRYIPIRLKVFTPILSNNSLLES